MTPINNIIEVLEVLPSPYLALKCEENNYEIIGFNSAYTQQVDPSVKQHHSLAEHLPLKEPLFEKKLYRMLAQCITQKKNTSFPFSTIEANYQVSITPIKEEPNGGVYLLVNFVVQQETETLMVQQDKQYYGFLDNMIEGCQVIGFDWKYIYINEAAAKQGRYNRQYYEGRSIIELYPGVEQTDLYRILQMCMQAHMIQKTEQEFVFNDGDKRWFDLHIYPSKDGIFILSLDITERKKHESELRKSEHRFRALYEHSVDMIVLFDKQLHITYRSPSTQKYIGWSEEQLNSINPIMLIHEDDQKMLRDIYTTVMAYPEKPLPVHARVMHRNGNYIWFEGTFTNLINDEAIEGFVLSVRDATERIKSETSLIKSEKELRQAQEIARIGYLHFDLVGNNSFWSDEMYHIWEQNKKEFDLTLDNFLRTIHPDDKVKFEEFLLKLFADFTHHEIEYRIKLPDGKVKYIFQRTELEHDETGKITALNGIALNVTERRLTEIALKESDDKFRILFNSSPLPQWLFDSDTLQFLDVNDAAVKNYGFSREEFLSMTLKELRPADQVEHFLNARQKKLSENKSDLKYRSFIHKKKDGTLINVDIHSSSVTLNGKNARLAIARDITAELAFEKQLLESNERYNLVLEATNESVIDWDIINDVTMWGKGFEYNFGYDLSQYNNHLWSGNIHPEDRDRVLTALDLTLNDAKERYFNSGFRYLKANGEIAYVQHRGIILRDSSGTPVRAIGAMIDVTQLNEKIAETELQNEKLKSIAWTQSHVVRAPVARIMGLISLLENKNMPVNYTSQLSEILSYIVTSAYELDDIIKDIVKKTENYTKHEFKSSDHR